MHELLVRWSELEPQRCEFDGLSFLLFFEGAKFRAYSDVVVTKAIVQAAVQEAIRAHGWWYELNRYERNGREVYACVGIKPSEPGKNNPIFRNHWGSEEVETFLTAYLAALEAQ